MSRLGKQLTYGSVFLLFWLGVGMLVYFAFFRPAPGCFNGRQDRGEEGIDCGGSCAAVCLPPAIQPLVFGETVIFRPAPRKIGVLVQIQNPNLDIAAKNFYYRIDLYDSSGGIIASRAGNSFVYAGESNRRLAEFMDVPDSQAVFEAKIVPGAPEWVPASRYPRPALEIPEKHTRVLDNLISADGKIHNRDIVAFPKVEVIAVFKDGFGLPIGVSRTELDDVIVGETRTWSIMHPPLAGIDTVRTDYFVYARRP